MKLRFFATALLSIATACSSTTGGGSGEEASGREEAGGSEEEDGEPTGAPEADVDLGGTPAGEAERCEVDALVSPEVYTRRVKTLLVGNQVTSPELQSVQEDPATLKDLISDWINTDAFKEKMRDFFMVTLQQTSRLPSDYVEQITDEDARNFPVGDRFLNTMTESMARTAVKIVEDDRPFTEIATTRTWMMTSEMMAYLSAADKTSGESLRYYHDPVTLNGIRFNSETPLSTQIANRAFYSSRPLNGCDDPYTDNRRNRIFSVAVNGPFRVFCGGDPDVQIYSPADRSDWREVTMVDGAPANWWNVLAFRGATQLSLNTPRTGYFSQPAFLASWRTNVDNSFRVTTNQTLIVGLGLAFEDTDLSTPLGDDGLAADHASPNTACYACHKNLDPMRNFFALAFDPNYYSVLRANEVPSLQPSFSFQGFADNGDDLEDFGAIIANHPYFAEGWTQKLCLFANAQECSAQDPAFQAVVASFEDSNFNFKTLVTELFSSRLVTGAGCAPGEESELFVTSVARREHLCTAVQQRLGMADLCSFDANVRSVAEALPTDGWSRGAVRPDQPTESSLFYTATAESLCSQIANRVVNRAGSPIQTSDLEGSVNTLVEDLMGISPIDPRYDVVHDWMSGHLADAAEIETTPARRLRSAVTLACTSPLLVSTEF